MLAITRKSQIKEIVLEKKSVSVAELAKSFSVTEETIRRDLKALEDEGLLQRTYGGAFIQDGVQNELSLTLRETAFVESKEAIAKICKTLIANGDSIFLDSSTTAMAIANEIKMKRITIVTNSLKIINRLSDCENIHLIAIGGILTPNSMSFTGRNSLQTLESYYMDKCFISCRSLSQIHGITDSNEQLAEIRQMVIKRSAATYIIADYSKFDKTSFMKICDYSAIKGIVTDKKLDESWYTFLADKNVEIYSEEHD